MKEDATLLVIVEPGARLPAVVHEERRLRPENVVIVSGGTLRVDEFAFRALERISALRDSEAVLERAIFVTAPGQGHASRSLLARALAERLGDAGGSEFVICADRPASEPTRYALLELVGELLDSPLSRRISVRVRFDTADCDSGVWSRVDGERAARVA